MKEDQTQVILEYITHNFSVIHKVMQIEVCV